MVACAVLLVQSHRRARDELASGPALLYSAGMVSVLIETCNDEESLPPTLASLMSGLLEGVVREAIVCDRGSTDQTAAVADQAGCTFLAGGGIATGIRQARSEWLLLIEPGARLVEGWTEAVLAHAARYAMPAQFRRSRIDRQPFLARLRSGNRALANGLLISRSQASALSKTSADAQALARGLAVRRLQAEIRVATCKPR